MAHIPPTMGLEDVDRGLPDGGEFLLAELKEDERTLNMIALLIWHGFLPMGGMGMLLPKIHKERCILAPGDVHVGKKVRRRAREGFHLTVNQAWLAVIKGVQEHTFTSQKGDCWLSDELARAYKTVKRAGGQWHREDVAFHSVELWHTASGKLVAGEIGCTCGSVYSSYTGFALKEEYPGAGSVQLVALGTWLARCGFAIWDLGMELEYKLELGGRPVPRNEWARRIRSLRYQDTELSMPKGAEADAGELLAGKVGAATEAATGSAAKAKAKAEPKASAKATAKGTAKATATAKAKASATAQTMVNPYAGYR